MTELVFQMHLFKLLQSLQCKWNDVSMEVSKKYEINIVSFGVCEFLAST